MCHDPRLRGRDHVFDLSGKVALVTGAGQGVGAGIATVLADAGADVCINDLDADRAAVAAIGPVDILVNNAGIPPSMRPVQFSELDPSEWAPYIDVNLYGVLNCVKAVLDGMYERQFGRIITISSGAGQTGLGIGVSIYAAGKGAGISFMRHLAHESGRKGVTANTLALGLMARPTPAAEEG